MVAMKKKGRKKMVTKKNPEPEPQLPKETAKPPQEEPAKPPQEEPAKPPQGEPAPAAAPTPKPAPVQTPNPISDPSKTEKPEKK
jgi:fused signal recognition particle receptor